MAPQSRARFSSESANQVRFTEKAPVERDGPAIKSAVLSKSANQVRFTEKAPVKGPYFSLWQAKARYKKSHSY